MTLDVLLKNCIDFILEHGKSYVRRTRLLPSQRHVLLYLSYVTAESALWWVGFGSSPLYLDQGKMMCVLDKPPAKHGECAVWYVDLAGGATLSCSEKLTYD